MKTVGWIVPALVLGIAADGFSAEKSRTGMDVDKISAEAAKFAPLLPEAPQGFGRPVTDRAAWEALAANPAWRGVVRHAEYLLKTPLPESPDDLYLDFSRTGNRSRWQKAAGLRRGRVPELTLAECLENRGRFLPPLEEVIAALCAEKTWVMPAHDRSLENFKGQAITIDLGSSQLACELAMARWLLGDRLGEKSRALIRDNVRRRIFGPYEDMLAGKQRADFWIRCTNNWNAVCHANVTIAALALIESRSERATYVAAAADCSKYFLSGFTPDGYCSEGLGYWNYGFGHFILLSEAIRQATGGKVDLLENDRAQQAATFPLRIEILNGVYPAFADCSVGTVPHDLATYYLLRRYGLGGAPADDRKLAEPDDALAEAMMYSFPNAATAAPPAAKKFAGPGIRSWFPDAGILICRPAGGAACRLAAALKGGHNAEHHNHNDVGSYVVVVGAEPVLLDIGAEVYTARTFSSRRYDSQALNSFGHPVPVVAGKLQKTGSKARAEVVKTDFTDEADTFVLDLRSAYDLKGIAKLLRTFVYSRKGDGSLTVTDEVEFDEPAEFETALLTLGQWKQDDSGDLSIRGHRESVRVSIDAGGGGLPSRSAPRRSTRTSRPTRDRPAWESG